MGKYKYSASEVNDPSGRRFIKSRTTTAPPAHVQGDVYHIPSGATGEWSTHIGEIAGSDGSAWIYEASPPDGLIIWVGDENLPLECVGMVLQLANRKVISFNAEDLSSPNNADWPVNALAPLVVDSNNAAVNVRLFDDTAEEGVGLKVRPTQGSTSVILTLTSRAETAPGAVRTVGNKLRVRGLPDNLAREAWSAGLVLNDIDIPTSEFDQEDTQTITLADAGMSAGELTQIELTRIGPSAGTNLEGDWALLMLGLEFI